MQKSSGITDGMKIVDTAEAVGGYNYYGYLRHNGEYVIMRENTAETEYRYNIGGYDYSTNWTNKATISYGLPTIN